MLEVLGLNVSNVETLGLFGFIMGMLAIIAIFTVILYVYFGFTLSSLAKKLGYKSIG